MRSEGRPWTGGLLGLAAVVGLFALTAATSQASFPGANGRIAYSDGSIWSANADGGSAVKLTDGSADWNPTYSPDGSRIAFERERAIFAMNADGSGLVPLIDGGLTTSSVTRWEQEYVTPQQPPRTIPFVKVQTSTSTWHSFDQPAFSPDGLRLAVAEVFEEHEFTVVCAVEEVGDEDCIDFGEPDAYLDSHLVCVSCSSRIVTIDSTSGAPTEDVTTPPEGSYDLAPAFSASGELAFEREGSFGASSIFVAGSLGSPPTQITSGPEDGSPDFSPDGSKIAFNHGGGIGVVAAAGGPVATLPVPNPPGGEGFAHAPAFSPDGTRIAFERGVFPQGTPGEGLYTIAVDGSGMSLVSGDGGSPSWGRFVAPPAPPPAKPAEAKMRKGKIRLSRKGKGRIGTIICGNSHCALAVSVATLKAGKRRCAVGARLAKQLEPGKSTPLVVKVTGRCLAALEQAGKGKLVTRVEVADQLGRKTLTFKAMVGPARATG